MKKRLLILRDPKTRLTVHSEYLEISAGTQHYIVAYRHIEAIYLNKANKIPVGTCYAISARVPFYLTDHNGYIVAQLKEVDDAQI